MTVCNIHLLNARHKLTGIMSELRATLREAVALVSEHIDIPDVDVVVRAETGGGIPTWGVKGRSAGPALIEITLDPHRFSAPLLTRTMIHEIHHLIRWDGPGYGRSLGEALVSEGLAGHFVLQLLGGKPDPWDIVTPAEGATKQAMNEWARLDYDHARWFSGAGDLRKWTGYGLGHRLIAEYLAENPDKDLISLTYMKADELRPTLRRLIKSGDDMPEPADDERADETPAS